MADRQIAFALSTVTWPEPYVERLAAALDARRFVHSRDPATIASALDLAEVAIIAGDLDDRHLAAPRLRWVHCDHAGLNRSARPQVFERGLLVTSSSGRSSDALAEHALFFMLSHAYRARALLRAQEERRWLREGRDELRSLFGATVGVIGLGQTGAALALRCHALGMRVLGYRRRAQSVAGVDRLFATDAGDGLDELLSESDYIVVATPLSDATQGLIGARELGLMKRSAFIVNVGRGEVIDQDALVEALHEGRIGGAGLDVFEVEPLPADSPLWEMPNVYITPHATPAVPDKTERSLRVVTENARRFRVGEPLLNLLQPEDVWTGARARQEDRHALRH